MQRLEKLWFLGGKSLDITVLIFSRFIGMGLVMLRPGDATSDMVYHSMAEGILTLEKCIVVVIV
jgi:hypothetical protein